MKIFQKAKDSKTDNHGKAFTWILSGEALWAMKMLTSHPK